MPTKFQLAVAEVGPHTKFQSLIPATVQNMSHLYLRVAAMPDFISHKKELMDSTPTVRFELILDPLLFGFMPLTTVLTASLVLLTTLVASKIVFPVVLGRFGGLIYGLPQKVVRISEYP